MTFQNMTPASWGSWRHLSAPRFLTLASACLNNTVGHTPTDQQVVPTLPRVAKATQPDPPATHWRDRYAVYWGCSAIRTNVNKYHNVVMILAILMIISCSSLKADILKYWLNVYVLLHRILYLTERSITSEILGFVHFFNVDTQIQLLLSKR